MRPDAKTMVKTLILTGCIALAGCGSKKESSTAVPMNNLEVVDGTATDAMTDLDGVQSEGTAMAVPANRSDNAAAPAPAPKNESAEKPAADTEVLSDQ
ncbi:hypothetical protein VVT58_10520 [Sphingobium sp. SJ10-10]|uniref:hypothetical protein n=1 Tax=unclassified Sphingobium TaxID=2611147 RepID=UPI00076FF714|nr:MULTISPECIES: hypothetical protein [Sphingomonadaceae]AMK22050.1 hypothetical protein K426_05490 [Sphingobium sp. TKS]MEC6702216.1 hypothetical protein [Sphingobium sp. SJ10-10]NML88085.1 hypothetical protein [Sphingobium sp. TB-6]